MKRKTSIKVISTGSFVPAGTLSNFDLEKIVDTNDDWIFSRTGIRNRHIANGEDTSDLAFQAARLAIGKVNYDTSKIGLILVATCTADYHSPSVACMVQAKLGLHEQDIACFDINAACTGFIYALSVASELIGSGRYSGALVIGADTLSKYTDYEDRSTCILFGDGAGAFIIESADEYKPVDFYLSARGEISQSIIFDPKIKMDGRKIYAFATKILEHSIRKVLENNNLTIDDIDVIIPHQANLRIIEKAAKSLNIVMDKFYINIDKYGNTSSASIPLAFDEFMTAFGGHGKKVIFVGFGGGLTWGAALLTL